jgi:hypothetical protein
VDAHEEGVKAKGKEEAKAEAEAKEEAKGIFV